MVFVISDFSKYNHPTKIIQELPISIETRSSKLSNNLDILHVASKHRQDILNQSW